MTDRLFDLVNLVNAAGEDYVAAKSREQRLAALGKLALAVKVVTDGKVTTKGAAVVEAARTGFRSLEAGVEPPQFKRGKKVRQQSVGRLNYHAFYEAGRRLLMAAGYTEKDALAELVATSKRRPIPLPPSRLGNTKPPRERLGDALHNFRYHRKGELKEAAHKYCDSLVTQWQFMGRNMSPRDLAQWFLNAGPNLDGERAPYLHSAAETHENEAEQGNSAAVLPFNRK